MGDTSELNAVLVPVYMTKAISGMLRRLGDACGRNDLRRDVAQARKIALRLDALPEEQGAPAGEHIASKAPMTKVPERTFQAKKRREEFEELFRQKILPVYERFDAEARGQIRFNLILTYNRG